MLDPHAELLRINARIKEILLQHMPRTGTAISTDGKILE